ncbi:MAG: hypothetical protein M0027_17900 [Candidatus Dormibacteraeota bacterium]|nr:hypothetical protein [Candidatus Dormibacteraeota bacterium]
MDQTGAAPTSVRDRTQAECAVRRLLFISEADPRPSDAEVERVFSLSLALSAMRCIFTYMVMPFLLPTIGALAGAGPVVGVFLSAVALVFDVRAIRAFWRADDPRRWSMTALYLFVIVFVLVLLALDLHSIHL